MNDITTAGGSLVNVGRVSAPAHCKGVADYFGRPFFVTIPTAREANSPVPTEFMCYVGGHRRAAPDFEPGYMRTGSEAAPDADSYADNASRSGLTYSYAGSLNRTTCVTQRGEAVRCMPKLVGRPSDAGDAAGGPCCACQRPVGYLTLVSPLPYASRADSMARVRPPPEMLKLFAAVRNQPWELRRRFSYYTSLRVPGSDINVPVHKGTFDCMRVGCEELYSGDVVELRDVFGHTSIQYKVNMYA
jgi:hypothetical protein